MLDERGEFLLDREVDRRVGKRSAQRAQKRRGQDNVAGGAESDDKNLHSTIKVAIRIVVLKRNALVVSSADQSLQSHHVYTPRHVRFLEGVRLSDPSGEGRDAT